MVLGVENRSAGLLAFTREPSRLEDPIAGFSREAKTIPHLPKTVFGG